MQHTSLMGSSARKCKEQVRAAPANWCTSRKVWYETWGKEQLASKSPLSGAHSVIKTHPRLSSSLLNVVLYNVHGISLG